VLEILPDGCAELMCHPGIYDADLERAATRLKGERQRELEALIAPEVARAVKERGIRLITFRELTQADA
jgi:predicted glycoside hydrolase/deacetylase ChbG (UPF0249 family)